MADSSVNATEGGGVLAAYLSKARQQGVGSGSAQMADPSNPLVWMGGRTIHRPANYAGANKPLDDGERLSTNVDGFEGTPDMPLDQATLSIRNWDDDDLERFTRKAWYLGFSNVGSPTDIQGAIDVWEKAVTEAAKWQAAGKQLTPEQAMVRMASAFTDNAAQRAEFSDGVMTQKQRQINLTDPLHAKALIIQAFQDSTGRDPTDAEIRTLTATLNGAERANPTTSTTTAQVDPTTGQTIGTPTTTTSGGINAGDFLSDTMRDDPEAAAYQAATTLVPALWELMGFQ